MPEGQNETRKECHGQVYEMQPTDPALTVMQCDLCCKQILSHSPLTGTLFGVNYVMTG